MKLHYMDCATMSPRLAGLFAPSLMRVSTTCILLEKEGSYVLIDAGFGTRDILDAKRLGPVNKVLNSVTKMEQTAVCRIKEMGIDPKRVENIVCTHLDSDHAGGLSDFPWANVHVMRKEYLAVVEPKNLAEKTRYRQCQFEHGPRWILHDEPETSEKTWFGLECITNIAGLPPEIVIVPLFGHSRGHCAVAIDTGSGWVIHCGDAFYVKEELHGKAPLGVRMFELAAHVDKREAKSSLARLKKALLRAKETTSVTPVGAHDPCALAR